MFRVLTLLMTGYGTAMLAAAAVFTAGASLLTAILTFWLGGAVAVCALAVLFAGRFEAKAVAVNHDEEAILEEALRQWEADRMADQSGADNRTGTQLRARR